MATFYTSVPISRQTALYISKLESYLTFGWPHMKNPFESTNPDPMCYIFLVSGKTREGGIEKDIAFPVFLSDNDEKFKHVSVEDRRYKISYDLSMNYSHRKITNHMIELCLTYPLANDTEKNKGIMSYILKKFEMYDGEQTLDELGKKLYDRTNTTSYDNYYKLGQSLIQCYHFLSLSEMFGSDCMIFKRKFDDPENQKFLRQDFTPDVCMLGEDKHNSPKVPDIIKTEVVKEESKETNFKSERNAKNSNKLSLRRSSRLKRTNPY